MLTRDLSAVANLLVYRWMGGQMEREREREMNFILKTCIVCADVHSKTTETWNMKANAVHGNCPSVKTNIPVLGMSSCGYSVISLLSASVFISKRWSSKEHPAYTQHGKCTDICICTEIAAASLSLQRPGRAAVFVYLVYFSVSLYDIRRRYTIYFIRLWHGIGRIAYLCWKCR